MDAKMNRINVLKKHLERGNTGAQSGVQTQETASASTFTGDQVLAEYDYVVVGAGSAGCALASRLSEDPKVTVLLLEAGGSNQNYMVRGPLVTCPKLQNTEMDWSYRSQPQTSMANRISFQPRGKMLGGCSSINYMLACRGDPRNYDQWANEYGCPGWSFDDVLPYFKKCETVSTSPEFKKEYDYSVRGKNGPIQVTDIADPAIDLPVRESLNRFIDACEEKGIPRNDDYNGRVQEGASMSQITVKNGVRCDTASAYLFKNKAFERENLTIGCHVHVMQVVFQGDRATGVTFKQGNYDLGTLGSRSFPSKFVRAKREVILCAGSFGTPQILMLSGVGPKEHLESKNISVVADLPGVGSNMQDHIMCPVMYEVKENANHFTMKPGQVLLQLIRYVILSQGMCMFPSVMGMAFWRSKLRKEDDGNDLQMHVVPFSGDNEELMETLYGYDISMPRHKTPASCRAMVFLPSLVRPFSTGSVRLNTNNPFDHPLIDFGFLSDERDMDMMVEAYKKTIEIVEHSNAFTGFIGARRMNPLSEFEPDSDEYIKDAIREETITIYHATSTCKMGPLEDPMTVVDPLTLKVKGFQNLRVADCSVAPQVVSGNTNLLGIMIGEKAADMIIASNKPKPFR